MIQSRPRKQLLYPFGILTFSLLPVLLFHRYGNDVIREPEVVFEATYMDPAEISRHRSYFNDKCLKLVLTGEPDDEMKLDSVQALVRGLLNPPNWPPGIEITFAEEAKYSSLIRLYNICHEERVRRYLNHGNKFVILRSPR